MARRKPTPLDSELAVADAGVLERRYRWLEMRLVCQDAGERESIREETLTGVRREAARRSDPEERLALMESAYAAVFGEECLQRWHRTHDRVLEREGTRRTR